MVLQQFDGSPSGCLHAWQVQPVVTHIAPCCAVQVYTDVKQLRYGHLMTTMDQDHDSSHIKGLIMNDNHHSCHTHG